MSEILVEKAVAVEKADASLGVIIFKCLATTPGVPDADDDILDVESVEKAFYDFMEKRLDTPVDIDHLTDVEGTIVAGWYFPDENCYRVAFRPKDAEIVKKAQEGLFVGSSFSGTALREPV